MRTMTAVLVLMLVTCLAGCGSPQPSWEITEDPTDLGKADAPTKALRFTLLHAGFFRDSGARPLAVPRLIHYGYANTAGPDWEAVTDVHVEYLRGQNLEVQIVVPPERRTQLLAYVIKYEVYGITGSTTHWTADEFLNLTEPRGQFAWLPVFNGAGYPFSKECYSVSVLDANQDTWVSYPGAITSVYYGFTAASLADYRANNDVAWLNALGAPAVQAQLTPHIAHDGGYKGSYKMAGLWARVPKGRNLVFKLAIDKWGGACWSDGDTVFLGGAETMTYFMEVAPVSDCAEEGGVCVQDPATQCAAGFISPESCGTGGAQCCKPKSCEELGGTCQPEGSTCEGGFFSPDRCASDASAACCVKPADGQCWPSCGAVGTEDEGWYSCTGGKICPAACAEATIACAVDANASAGGVWLASPTESGCYGHAEILLVRECPAP